MLHKTAVYNAGYFFFQFSRHFLSAFFQNNILYPLLSNQVMYYLFTETEIVQCKETKVTGYAHATKKEEERNVNAVNP